MDNQTRRVASRLTRREILRLSTIGLLGGVGVLLAGCEPMPGARVPAQPAAQPTQAEPLPESGEKEAPAGEFQPDVEFALRAVETTAQILPGAATRVWSYQGKVLQGDPDALQTLPDSFLGPTLRVRKGQKVRIHFTNELPEESIVHWHGMHVPADMDGHPRSAVGPGETYVYEFEVHNRAGTYWYHPHPHGRTGPQVNQGLAGLLIVSDEEEEAAGLPAGDQEMALVLQDRTFDADNQFVYLPGGMMDRMMDQMMGFLGDTILVNGQPDFVLPVGPGTTRLRLLNGSNSRVYKLGWQDDTPLTVIASDGGLLERPVQRPYVTLSPGERVELWADFSHLAPGSEVELWSLAYTGVEAGDMMAGSGMGGMPMHGMTELPNGEPFPVLVARVEDRAAATLPLPETLSTLLRYRAEDAVNAGEPRTFQLFMRNMQWTLNGRVFEMAGVAEEETVRLDSLEVWEFVNELEAPAALAGHGGHGAGNTAQPDMMVDFMAHPMHIHGLQFQVLERQIAPEQRAGWETVQAGYVDEGWKDTVLVMPGERVKLLMQFADYTGLFVYHCHNLEHEDMGMMRNYRVRA